MTRSKLRHFLHQIVLDIMKHLELTELLDAIVRQAAQLVEAPAGFVYLVGGDQQNVPVTILGDSEGRIHDFSLSSMLLA